MRAGEGHLNGYLAASPATPDGRGRWRETLLTEWRLAAFCACVAAIALLYNIFNSPDVLYDEAAYTWAAQQVAHGWHLTLDNQPLFVHPPLMFLLQAAWLHLTGHASVPLSSAIRMARLLAASVGVADVLLVAGLAFRLTSSANQRRRRVLTGLVAILTALDPVLVRYDRQNVIEPFALCISLIAIHAAWGFRARGALAYVSVTGLVSGLALLTNEITIFLVVVPLIFALIEKNGLLVRRSIAALAIAIGFLLLFLVWAVELGLGGSFLNLQTITLRRLIGLVQLTGLNEPGVSLVAALERSVVQYSSSYVVLAIGFGALIWCWTRRNTQAGNFLTAWLTASYVFGAYIIAVGTLNEQFFVYLLPASIVGTVLFADALIVGWRRQPLRMQAWVRKRETHRTGTLQPALMVGGVACLGLIGVSGASWATNYVGASDGVIRVDQFIASKLPTCAAVNASGDPNKYSYVLGGRSFAYFSVGPAALADGVHYFVLAPNDAVERTGDMSPALATWIRDNGHEFVSYPSQVYKTVQLWYVPASSHDPFADIVDVSGGAYINTVSSHCGGYMVTNGRLGGFYSEYQALGGKSVVGDPLSRIFSFRQGVHEQAFQSVVLVNRAAHGSDVRALPIVAALALKSPTAYRQAGLPALLLHRSESQRRSWLTNASIRRVYLGGRKNDARSYADAVRRYGPPLGPPSVLPGGNVGQPFANIVLEAPRRGGRAHAATVTPYAVAAGALKIPTHARNPQSPPPLPNPFPLGPAEPTSAKPFVLTLGLALLLYTGVVAMLGLWLRRRRRQSAVEPWWDEAAS